MATPESERINVQRYFWLLFVVLLAGACAPQATFGDAITQGEPTPIPTAVVAARPIYDVTRGDVVDQRTYFGRISAVTTVQLQFTLQGTVNEVLVSVGQDVRAGDVLARLESTALQEQLLDAEEQLAIAQSFLEAAQNQVTFARRRAELEVDLARTMLDAANARAGTPASDTDVLTIRQREIELELAQLALEQISDGVDPALAYDVSRAQEQVELANDLLNRAVLVAPMDGRLISFLVGTGENVTAYATVGLVADVSQVEITDSMDDMEMSNLTEGLSVVAQRANAPDSAYEATLAQMPAPYGTGDDPQVHFRFNTQPEPSEFQIGERMSLIITIAERKNVLWLPASAIRQFGGRDFVVVQEDGVERRVDVRLGLEGNDRVEILEGLEENQRVVAP
jgi:multidrug efflux pump subunit AcrA (membrane-fusion protein)